mmetsp:Transcript_175288/g.426391  ORF Transcript_175288/g.426391 Transcript_175288/m.426391 type:complete len:302 (+) Transcript_175288:2202-3107(+)
MLHLLHLLLRVPLVEVPLVPLILGPLLLLDFLLLRPSNVLHDAKGHILPARVPLLAEDGQGLVHHGQGLVHVAADEVHVRLDAHHRGQVDLVLRSPEDGHGLVHRREGLVALHGRGLDLRHRAEDGGEELLVACPLCQCHCLVGKLQGLRALLREVGVHLRVRDLPAALHQHEQPDLRDEEGCCRLAFVVARLHERALRPLGRSKASLVVPVGGVDLRNDAQGLGRLLHCVQVVEDGLRLARLDDGLHEVRLLHVRVGLQQPGHGLLLPVTGVLREGLDLVRHGEGAAVVPVLEVDLVEAL